MVLPYEPPCSRRPPEKFYPFYTRITHRVQALGAIRRLALPPHHATYRACVTPLWRAHANLATTDTLLKIDSRFSSAVVRETHELLLANLFPRYKAEMSAELFPSLGAFKEVKGEAKF